MTQPCRVWGQGIDIISPTGGDLKSGLKSSVGYEGIRAKKNGNDIVIAINCSLIVGIFVSTDCVQFFVPL